MVSGNEINSWVILYKPVENSEWLKIDNFYDSTDNQLENYMKKHYGASFDAEYKEESQEETSVKFFSKGNRYRFKAEMMQMY